MGNIDWNTQGGRRRRERIEAALSARSLNVHELAAELAMTRKWAGQNIGELHRTRRVYIKEWRPWHSQTWLLPCYAWGDQDDAPRPAYQQQASQAKRIDAIMADPERREQRQAKRRKADASRTQEQRAAEFQRWKARYPEAYVERMKKGAQATSLRRAKQRDEAAEKERAEAAAAKIEAYNEAMRAARRHAKTIEDEDERKRYLSAQQLLNRPAQRDPLVALLFGGR